MSNGKVSVGMPVLIWVSRAALEEELLVIGDALQGLAATVTYVHDEVAVNVVGHDHSNALVTLNCVKVFERNSLFVKAGHGKSNEIYCTYDEPVPEAASTPVTAAEQGGLTNGEILDIANRQPKSLWGEESRQTDVIKFVRDILVAAATKQSECSIDETAVMSQKQTEELAKAAGLPLGYGVGEYFWWAEKHALVSFNKDGTQTLWNLRQDVANKK